MRKVILISSVPPPMGGIAKWTQRMLDLSLPDGWDIDLVDDKLVGKRDSFGDSVRYNYMDEVKRWWNVWRTLRKKIKQADAFVAHACPIATVPSMIVNYISASIVKAAGKKHIIHFRCTVPNLVKTSFQLVLLRKLCNKSDYIICLNTQTKEYLEKYTKTPIVLIPNFVDEAEIQTHNISSTIKNALYVGGVTKDKGCDHMIEVARLQPNVIFNLVGVASTEIKAQAQGLNNVKFWGVQKGADLTELYKKADVFFFLSRFWGEGFSNAVAEAMAAGLPCIVTKWAANADQIEDEKGGFVVGSDVVSDSLYALGRLEDQNVRSKMSIFNTEKVAREYSSEVIIKQYVKCYNNLTYNE